MVVPCGRTYPYRVPSFKVRVRRRVPDDAQAVDIEKYVPCIHVLFLRRRVIVWEKLQRILRRRAANGMNVTYPRKVMLMNLLGKTVLRRDEDIFEKTWLHRGEICEPSASCERGDFARRFVLLTDTWWDLLGGVRSFASSTSRACSSHEYCCWSLCGKLALRSSERMQHHIETAEDVSLSSSSSS